MLDAQERALAAEERDRLELLSAAVDCAGDGIVILEMVPANFESRKIVYVNPALCQNTGFTSAEFYAAKSTYILHGANTDQKAVAAFRDDLLAGRPSRAELEIYRKDGTPYWAEIHGRPITGGDPNVVRWVLVERDVTARKKEQERLALLSAAIEATSDFVFITSADDRHGSPVIQYVNASMLRETGYVAEELLGRSPAIFFGTGTDLGVIASIRHAIKEHQTASGEFLAYRKDGSAAWTEFNGRPVFDRSGACTHWVAVGRDTTKRRRDLERLAVLTEAMESATDSIIVYEILEDKRPTIVFVNDATIEQSGFTREELLAGSTGTGPETDSEAIAKLLADLQAGHAVRTRLRLYRKNGTAYWGDVSARPIFGEAGKMTHWISIERDITQLIDRERELESERDLLTQLVDLSRDLFQSLDGPSLVGALTRALESLFGSRVTRIHSSEIPAGSPGKTFPVPLSLGCGNIALFIEDPDANVLRPERRFVQQLIMQTFDAAARNVALYQELQDRRATLMETNQRKNDLIAMLGHDFRGPLTSILGFADLLLQDHAATSDSHFALRSIAESARHLSELAGNTLAMARIERNELELSLAPLDLRTLIEDIVASIGGARTIEVQCDHRHAPIVGDAARLRQVFTNLIDNAVKFSPGGQPVTVRIHSDGRGATVSVTDRGIGVPPDEADAVFSRFMRGTNARRAGIGGSGFGLFLARSIIEQHGGTIEVRGEDGTTTFTVSLPHGASTGVAAVRIILLDPAGESASSTALELRQHGYAVRVYDTPLSFESALESVSYDAAIVEGERLEPEHVVRIRATGERSKLNVIIIEKPRLGASLIESVEEMMRGRDA